MTKAVGLMACVEEVAKSNVYPSGLAFLTSIAPIEPAAPALLSTITVWPSNAGQLLRRHAADDVGRACRRERHHQPDRALREFPFGADDGGCSEGAKAGDKKMTTLHCFLPVFTDCSTS